MNIEHNGYKFIGKCSMDNIQDFDTMSYELKQFYGRKNVWFDRDYETRTIIFLTHL